MTIAPRVAWLRRLDHIAILALALLAVAVVLVPLLAERDPLHIDEVLARRLIPPFARDAQGSWQESHFRWRIRSVVIAAVAYAVTLPLWLLLIAPGWIAWGVISLWFLYRVLRGWIALNNRQQMPV